MQSTSQVSLTNLTREEKLQIWMRRQSPKVTYRMLGKYLGIEGSSALNLCRGETMPTRRFIQCRDFGIPEECLPIPMDLTPGPKPRKTEACVNA